MNPILLAMLFGIGWAPFFLLRAESMRDALPHYGGAERFWVRVSPLIISLHVALACVMISFGPPPPSARCAIGVALFAAALSFWLWARAQIGPFDERPLPDDPPRSLRRDGPFGLVRNPLYLAYLVAAAAPAIVAGQPILLVTWLAAFAALAVRAAQEERRLRAQLGDAYDEYCRSVKRLLPFVW